MNGLQPLTIQIDDCWNRIGVWGTAEAHQCPKLEEVTHCQNCKVFSNAGRKILERAPGDEYRKEWTEILSREKIKSRANTVSVVIFRLGDETMALASQLIDEITEIKPVHRLPHSRGSVVRGLVNIRGELQICVSLGFLLGLDKGDTEAEHRGIFNRMIMASKDGNRLVFPVTEVHGTYRYAGNDLEAVPSTVSKAKASYSTGVIAWKDEHVACLDEELLFNSLGRSLS